MYVCMHADALQFQCYHGSVVMAGSNLFCNSPWPHAYFHGETNKAASLNLAVFASRPTEQSLTCSVPSRFPRGAPEVM